MTENGQFWQNVVVLVLPPWPTDENIKLCNHLENYLRVSKIIENSFIIQCSYISPEYLEKRDRVLFEREHIENKSEPCYSDCVILGRLVNHPEFQYLLKLRINKCIHKEPCIMPRIYQNSVNTNYFLPYAYCLFSLKTFNPQCVCILSKAFYSVI